MRFKKVAVAVVAAALAVLPQVQASTCIGQLDPQGNCTPSGVVGGPIPPWVCALFPSLCKK